MLKATRKLTRNGNGIQINVPRQMLLAMGLMPGDEIRLTCDEAEGVLYVRAFENRETVSRGALPSVVFVPGAKA